MSKMYKAKVFESLPWHVKPGEIIDINLQMPDCLIQNYSIIEGTLTGLQPGNYVIELVQLHNNYALPYSKYTYITSCGEKTIKYGFAYTLQKLTTELKINVYVVAI